VKKEASQDLKGGIGIDEKNRIGCDRKHRKKKKIKERSFTYRFQGKVTFRGGGVTTRISSEKKELLKKRP